MCTNIYISVYNIYAFSHAHTHTCVHLETFVCTCINYMHLHMPLYIADGHFHRFIFHIFISICLFSYVYMKFCIYAFSFVYIHCRWTLTVLSHSKEISTSTKHILKVCFFPSLSFLFFIVGVQIHTLDVFANAFSRWLMRVYNICMCFFAHALSVLLELSLSRSHILSLPLSRSLALSLHCSLARLLIVQHLCQRANTL